MVADSNSRIAWHRAQIKRHREALKEAETARFGAGKSSLEKSGDPRKKTTADLVRKIRVSEQVVAAYERQARRPLTTDFQTLANAPWSKWNGSEPSSME